MIWLIVLLFILLLLWAVYRVIRVRKGKNNYIIIELLKVCLVFFYPSVQILYSKFRLYAVILWQITFQTAFTNGLKISTL